MKEPYLEVTFRHGRPLAAYLYLPRQPGAKSHRTEEATPGVIVDFDLEGRPIGLEITAPTKVSLSGINSVLQRLGLSPVTQADLAPLQAA
jgi:hypothetical protein